MIKHKTYNLIEKGANGSRINLTFDFAIMTLILLNVMALILESFSEYNKSFQSFLRIFEIVSVVIFSLEFLLRIYVSDITHPSNSRIKSALKFIFSAYGLIDLLVIIP